MLSLRCLAATALLFVPVLCTCAPGKQTQAGQAVTTPAPSSTDVASAALMERLPGLDELADISRQRQVSNDPVFAAAQNGDSFLLASAGVLSDNTEHTATLNSSPGALEYAIYEFAEVNQALKIGGVQALYSSVGEGVSFIALSNYSSGRWQIFSGEPGTLGPLSSSSITADPLADYSSPAGSVFVAVIHWDAMEGTVRNIILGAGVVFESVQDFTASRGSFTDTVRLEWQLLAGAES